MSVCTFTGHREVYKPDIIQNVRLLVDTVLEMDDEVISYNGGMGEFDTICARVVNEARHALQAGDPVSQPLDGRPVELDNRVPRQKFWRRL